MGTLNTLCVSLIMAMSMQCTFVTQFLSSALATRGDMIDFDDVTVSKEQLTPSAFFRLLLQELSQRPVEHGVSPESLTPIQQIPIVGRSCSFDLDMPLDLRVIMLPENGSVVGEDPSLSLIYVPVRVGDPGSAFVWVAAFSPALKLLKQQVSAVLEGGIGNHTPIVIGPSMYHLVQFFDELSL